MARSAAAECWNEHEVGAVAGVAPDGSFVYRVEGGNEAADNGSIVVEWRDPDGKAHTTFALCTGAECEKKGWQVTGQKPPPELTAGHPKPDELVARLRTQLGATGALAPSPLPVRVVDDEENERHIVRSGAATLYLLRLRDFATSEWPTQRWHAELEEAPGSPLLFLHLKSVSHTHAVADCTEIIDVVRWLPRRRLEPGDRSAELSYCVDGARKPLDCLVATGVESALTEELLTMARAPDGDRDGAIGAAAKLALATRPRALVELARGGDRVARAYALQALTDVLGAYAEGHVHGPAADALHRAALVKELEPVCAARKADGQEVAAAAEACRKALEEAGPEVGAPSDSACAPNDGCRGRLLGVGADGGFVVEEELAKGTNFVGRAADGTVRFRISRGTIWEASGWQVEGEVTPAQVALIDDDPSPAGLRARLIESLRLTPAAPTRVTVQLSGDRIKAGYVTLARAPESHMRTVQVLAHPRSELYFFTLGKPRCPRPPCQTVVWGERPTGPTTDRAKLVADCMGRSSPYEGAECLADLDDETLFEPLLELARRAKDPTFASSPGRLAAHVGPGRLVALAAASDPFTRELAYHGLADMFDDADAKARVDWRAEVGRACIAGLEHGEPRVLQEALKCAAAAGARVDKARLMGFLTQRRQPWLRHDALQIAMRQRAFDAGDVGFLALFLDELLDGGPNSPQDWLHADLCHILAENLRPEDRWAAPLIAARLATIQGVSQYREACEQALKKVRP
jgi:hypothetical protein